MTDQVLAIGVDGCRAGWIAALAHGGKTEAGLDVVRTELRLYAASGGGLGKLIECCEALRIHGNHVVLGVDIPMGLPRRAGLRDCDVQARTILGRRRQCVFPAPDRELLGLSFEAARTVVLNRRARETGTVHAVMTKQTMAIAPKIAEADVILGTRADRQHWLVEVHPELSFLAIASELKDPAGDEGLPRKKRSSGRSLRRALVGAVYPDACEQIASVSWPRAMVGRDDVLDAYAALWSALRYRREGGVAHGKHLTILGDGVTDDRGLRAQIVI